jgi:hypothetical protein
MSKAVRQIRFVRILHMREATAAGQIFVQEEQGAERLAPAPISSGD